jgi:hypothetical protein
MGGGNSKFQTLRFKIGLRVGRGAGEMEGVDLGLSEPALAACVPAECGPPEGEVEESENPKRKDEVVGVSLKTGDGAIRTR